MSNKTTSKYNKRARQTQWHVVWLAGNKIGDEGARGLGDALKTNTTLTVLDLRSEQQEKHRTHNKRPTTTTTKQTTGWETKAERL